MAKPGAAVLFRIGLQYYISARTAVRHCHAEVAGNLFHHSFEMMFKGILLHKSVQDLKTLQDKKHALPWFWEETKKVVPQDWRRLEAFIRDLHRWELIRFGQFPRGKPRTLAIQMFRGAAMPKADPTHDRYQLCLEDADDLFTVLVGEMGWLPASVWGSEIDYAVDDYKWKNRHILTRPADS